MRFRFLASLALVALALLMSGAPTLAASGTTSAGWQARNATARYSPDTQECAFLSTINSYRRQHGLRSLKLSLTLGAAATHHSRDMAMHDYFSHTLYNGTTWAQNIANYGYPSDSSRGENIAAGYSRASSTFTQWKNSPGHNANMLSTSYKAIGIARAYNADSTYGWYWTTTFGSVVDTTVSC